MNADEAKKAAREARVQALAESIYVAFVGYGSFDGAFVSECEGRKP
jgi:hypothetical protein